MPLLFISITTLPQLNWALDLIDRHDFKGMSRIVDLGCRNGVAAMEIARRSPGAHVIGIDFPSRCCRWQMKIWPGIRSRIWNSACYRLLKWTFISPLMLFVSISYMHWIENKLEVLRAIKRSLRPSGQVFLSFFADHQRERFDWCMKTVSSQDKWKDYFIDYQPQIKLVSASQFANIVYDSGLILQRLEFIRVHDVFVSKLQFMDWFTTWCDNLKYLA